MVGVLRVRLDRPNYQSKQASFKPFSLSLLSIPGAFVFLPLPKMVKSNVIPSGSSPNTKYVDAVIKRSRHTVFGHLHN